MKKLIDARLIKKGDHFKLKGGRELNLKVLLATSDAWTAQGMVNVDTSDDGQDGASVNEGEKVWLIKSHDSK